MKKFIVLFLLAGTLGVFALAGLGLANNPAARDQDFLRLHIRANSNTAADQNIKYQVKQAIVNELTPLFTGVLTKAQALATLNDNLARIESTANGVLAAAGFTYTARAALKTELFPTRAYNDLVLPEGLYDALIIELGTGTGDNWWCVVYPPLCFLENNIAGDPGIKYRSKLHEIIKKLV